MFKFLSKSEIAQIQSKIKVPFIYLVKGIRLKSYQDLYALNFLKNIRNAKIAEIGGGFSRILFKLHKSNSKFNYDKFEGQGGGPKFIQEFLFRLLNPKVKILNKYLGNKEVLSDQQGSYDYIYSISVIEHIPINSLSDFFKDTVLLLKKGGVCLHLIDMYLASDGEDDKLVSENIERFNIYKKCIDENNELEFLSSDIVDSMQFKTSYISNPDNIMFSWNKRIPELSKTRYISQSVSLVIAYKKNDY